MKIALINSIYKPDSRGGAEIIFGSIVAALNQRGHDVFVIASGRKDQIENIDGIKIYRLKPLNLFSFLDINIKPAWQRLIWHVLDVFNLNSYFKIKKILKAEAPVLVWTHNLKGLGYLTLAAVRRQKIKNIHSLHDVQLANPSGLILKDEEQLWRNNNLFIKIYERINRWLFNSPSIVLSPSQWLLDFYTTKKFFLHSQKIILPNPVADEIKNSDQQNKTSEPCYLYAGQIEKYKGVEFLLSVWEKFNQGRLLVAGQGSLLDELKDKYKDNQTIEFLGHIPHQDLGVLFRKVNFTVVPSLCYENSPTVIYDSFNYGVPVIAADIGGVAELVKDGFNGYTFIAGDKLSLLNKLNLSLEHLPNADKLGQNGRVQASAYNIKKYLDKILLMLKK